VAEGDFVLSLVLLFGLSVMAVYAGVAAIIGAFLAGMALSESVRSESKHMVHGATELLVPFFLVNIGINLDFKSFQSREMIVLAILVVVVAVLSKLVGCGLGAWSLGRTDAIRVGVGMVPRGEVGMVVAQIGLGMGVISQSIYGVAVFMAVVTTMVAPPLLKWAYKGAKAEEAAAS
jgi:Kef-type K+ transport system membrane component KefB